MNMRNLPLIWVINGINGKMKAGGKQMSLFMEEKKYPFFLYGHRHQGHLIHSIVA